MVQGLTDGVLATARAAGFPFAGEALALDLADTVVTVTTPATDLLADPDACARWWQLQAERLPAQAAAAGQGRTRALRDALRATFEAHLAAQPPPAPSLDAVNAAAAAAPTSVRLLLPPAGMSPTGQGPVQAPAPHVLTAGQRWHADDGQTIALAAVAASAVQILSGPAAARLRRCANPGCSMLFVATDARRTYCTQDVCGNRARVARHYQRHRSTT